MTLEDRIERLEKIALALEPCIPQSRYAKEYGLRPEDIMMVKGYLSEIKCELTRFDIKLHCRYFDCKTETCGRGYELDCDNCMHFRTF